ncbi:MAG: fatty acid desaturase [Candidatus Azotimanducaceae bacterium]|jgi:fatty acid desaturase
MAYARYPMAPPKRKTGGGRVTDKGTRPGDRPATRSNSAQSDHEVAASSRYTPKAKRQQLIPPNWIPVIMLVLLIGGGLLIMARYLIFTESNWPTLAGLIAILGGLYTATKWQ